MRRLGLVGALVVLAVIGVTAGAAGAVDTFRITGEVDGLYPGYRGALDAHVTNPLDVPIRVTALSARATASGGGCDPSTLTIDGTLTSLELAPGATGIVPLQVAMSSDAGDACQGASFSVLFRGSSLAQDRPPPSLAFTGDDVAALMVVALVLVGAGFVLVRRARPRVTP